MSVASNPLLQLSSTASTQATTLANLSKTAEPAKDTSSDFAKVYAKQSQPTTAKATVTDHQQAASKQDQVASQTKSKTASDKDTAAAKPSVAGSGKDLPAHKTAKADKGDSAAKSDKTGKADKAKDDDQGDDTVTDATATDTPAVAVTTPDPTTPVAPTPDLTQVQAQQPSPVPDPAQTAALVQVPTPAPAQDATASTNTDSFDPSKDDPLANMPTLRLALEQSAKAQGTTSAHAQTDDKAAASNANVNSDADQSFATGLAAMVVQQKSSGESDVSDQAFGSQIDGGLKNVKGATADTRIDDFANRLAAMTDAPTAKTAAATPVQAPTTQLAMNQSGWTEGVVNRVMYLSSQNLKSADIQLTPAELGRLSIRVDMSPDQATAVTFTSAHLHVREALESQQGKLKDMFAEQGMGQLDVNVSDQSRQSSQDQAQQGQRTSRGSSGSDSLDGVAAASPLAAEPTVQQVIVGTSAIDYYA